MSVDSHHGLEVGLTRNYSAASDETTQGSLLDIACQGFTFSHGTRGTRSWTCRFGGFCVNTRPLIGGVRSLGSGVFRNFLLLAGVVVIFLFLWVLSYPEH